MKKTQRRHGGVVFSSFILHPSSFPGGVVMRVAPFLQRYPPALGGSEADVARLSPWLAARRDDVTVFTTPPPQPHALGDPAAPRDATRRAYTSPALLSLARDAGAIFVQTEGERKALLERGFAPERVILQGMGLDAASCTGGDRARARRAWGVGEGEVV